MRNGEDQRDAAAPADALSIVITVPFLAPAEGYGGPPRTVHRTAAELAQLGHRVRVVTSALGLGAYPPRDVWVARPGGYHAYYAGINRLSSAPPFWTPGTRVALRQALLEGADVCHLQLGFTYLGVAASALARRCGVPTVLTPHGVYGVHHMAQRRWAKRAFRMLFENRIVRRVRAVHALTAAEEEAVRRCFGHAVPVWVIPNGVDMPPASDHDTAAGSVEAGQERCIVFLGRVDRLKGLDLLIPAFCRARQHVQEPWHLVVAGPDYGFLEEARRLAAAGGASACVRFAGPVYREAKERLLRQADVFALTSYAEGHPVSVLEACARGVPVLVTDRCNLPEISDCGGGLCCSCTLDSVTDALTAMMTVAPGRRAAWGDQARQLVRTRFRWSDTARKLVALYRQVCADAPFGARHATEDRSC